MKKDRTCKYCNTVFNDIEGHVFSNHVKWCDKNPNLDRDDFSNKMKKGMNGFYDTKLGPFKSFLVNCDRCNNEFEVIERESKFPSKEKYYCSRKCANTKTRTKEENAKLSETIKHSEKCINASRARRKGKERICKYCNKPFYNHNKYDFCCRQCKKNYDQEHRFENSKNPTDWRNKYPDYWEYRQDCNFAFNLADFPNEFNFSLIKKYGWYKPKNRGDNLDGVSRDHMVSVKYGYEKCISPKIISHPANCQLMVHNDNISKYISNAITLEELMAKIESWNEKYKEIMTNKYKFLI